MGRPVNKRNFGDPSDPGSQLIINIKDGTSFILNQKGSSRFTADDDGSGSSGLVTLVNEHFPDEVGEASIIIRVGTNPGENATATSRLGANSVVKIISGTGYVIGNTLTFSEGTFSTQLVITVNTIDEGGGVTSFTLTNGGDFTVLPSTPGTSALTGTGTGATFVPEWGVAGITITAAGDGYVNPPVVQISGGEGAGASAVSTLDLDTVEGATVTNSGADYTFFPTVSIIRTITAGSIETVKILHNRTARTFQGNSYKWSPGAGFTGDDNAGNITST